MRALSPLSFLTASGTQQPTGQPYIDITASDTLTTASYPGQGAWTITDGGVVKPINGVQTTGSGIRINLQGSTLVGPNVRVEFNPPPYGPIGVGGAYLGPVDLLLPVTFAPPP